MSELEKKKKLRKKKDKPNKAVKGTKKPKKAPKPKEDSYYQRQYNQMKSKYDRLTESEKEYVDSVFEYESFKKSTAVLLWLFTGIFGGHRYYFKDTGGAIGMTLTLGGFGVIWLLDGISITSGVVNRNNYIKIDIINRLEEQKRKDEEIRQAQRRAEIQRGEVDV